ncbi:MAG: inositol monophosphatase family protein [Alphaproteobacteria bacterium]|nr:MAG: inositol monophosphatase family protein [Alphaproteobacteria bacterium]
MSEERHRLALDLVRAAGRMAQEGQARLAESPKAVVAKGPQDFVTEMDLAVEDFLRERINAAFPDDDFLGEEAGPRPSRNGGGEFTWVVDPIDGTSNYMRGLEYWAVSVACIRGDEPVLGAVWDGATARLYHARAGDRAFCEDSPLRPSTVTDPARALALLGSSGRGDFRSYLQLVERLHARGLDYRRLGAAAPGILRVASGQAEIFFEEHLNSWDALAALAIAQAAGCVCTPVDERFIRAGGTVLVTSPALPADIRGILAADPAARRGTATGR